MSVDPDNQVLRDRADEAQKLRNQGKFTLPTTLTLELATNPFLRTEERAVQSTLHMLNADPAAVFAELRERKNRM